MSSAVSGLAPFNSTMQRHALTVMPNPQHGSCGPGRQKAHGPLGFSSFQERKHNLTARRSKRRTDLWKGVEPDNRLGFLLYGLNVSPRAAVLLDSRLSICLRDWLGLLLRLASLLPSLFLRSRHHTVTPLQATRASQNSTLRWEHDECP